MVVSNSTWVRPAQALVYVESGKMRYFPPRNSGPIPRALTFHDDWENSRDCEQMDSSYDNGYRPYYNEESCHVSFMVTEGSSTNFSVDDPPEEYQSFEHEYSQQPVLKETDEYEVPSMSTPTEQYTNLVRRKKQTLQTLSSGATGDCLSPLLQADCDSYLPLDALIDLYSQKMHAARMTKSPKPEQSRPQDHPSSSGGPLKAEDPSTPASQDSDMQNLVRENTSDTSSQYLGRSTDSYQVDQQRATLVLRRIDLEILLQHIEKMIDRSDSAKNEDSANRWLCHSIEEIETLIDECCRETVKFEMMD